ncbi:MAG: dephospho-CoA kinase [Vicinamibacterales bacterium]
MRRVALTGGIATGKSYVLSRLAQHGLPVIDADRVVHGLLRAGSPVLQAIEARFGRGVIGADGNVDRRVLAGVVFSDSKARADLEKIVHPLAYRAIDEWFESAGSEPGSWVGVADIPLLYETGHASRFDGVVVASCEPEVQVRRVMERDRLSEPDARRRLDAQWPIEEKARRADWVIETGGTFAETDRQVAEVLQEMRRRWPR